MDKELKKKWIKALRSGEYKQGHGSLCALIDGTPKYCPLGVLCEVAEIPKKLIDFGIYKYEGFNSMLSPRLNRKFGFNYTDEGLLIKMNDKSNRSFNEIADWIEENL